jgi:hypothetical protein
MPEPRRAGTLVLFVAAWAVNLAFDGLGWFARVLPPPHLLVEHMPEMIRGMVSPAVIGPVATAVLAGIDVLLIGVVPPAAPRRTGTLAAWLFGFWVLAEGLLAWVWLSAPGGLVAVAVLGGAVRSIAVAWVLVRLEGPAPVPR